MSSINSTIETENSIEIWKDIPGFFGYRVSNFGHVKSFRQNKVDGRPLKPAIDTSGYRFVVLRKNNKNHNTRIHRLIGILWVNNPENKPYINHKDGNKINNSISNLEWVTHKENCTHARETGLVQQEGENSPLSQLTNDQVIEIKKALVEGETQISLATKYHVDRNVINQIKRGKSWKTVGPEYDLTSLPDSNIGENHPVSKLNTEQVHEIKILLRDGETHQRIADMYEVSRPTISHIKSGKTWSHVTI